MKKVQFEKNVRSWTFTWKYIIKSAPATPQALTPLKPVTACYRFLKYIRLASILHNITEFIRHTTSLYSVQIETTLRIEMSYISEPQTHKDELQQQHELDLLFDKLVAATYSPRSYYEHNLIYIIIILGRQEKVRRVWNIPYQSKDPSPPKPTYRL